MTPKERKDLKVVPYALSCGSLMYVMLCTRPDIYFSMGMVSRYQSNPGQQHWSVVKPILKYLRRTKDYMLIYKASHLFLVGLPNQISKRKRIKGSPPRGVFLL